MSFDIAAARVLRLAAGIGTAARVGSGLGWGLAVYRNRGNGSGSANGQGGAPGTGPTGEPAAMGDAPPASTSAPLPAHGPPPCRECPLRSLPGLIAPGSTQREWIEHYRAGERQVAKGDDLLRQGAPGDRLFTVLEGVLIRARLLEDGRRQVVNVMFPGDLIGLQAAFDGEMSHSVTALTDSRLCLFPRDRFMDLVTAQPRFAYDVIWLSAREEDALEQHLVAVGQRPARERVAYLALWLMERGMQTGLVRAHELHVPITQSQVADMLGLSLVHTNRTFQTLRKAGLIDWNVHRIHIPDLDRVRDWIGFDRAGLPARPYI